MQETSYWSVVEGGGSERLDMFHFGIPPATIFSENSDTTKQACEPYLQFRLPSVDVICRLIQFLQFTL